MAIVSPPFPTLILRMMNWLILHTPHSRQGSKARTVTATLPGLLEERVFNSFERNAQEQRHLTTNGQGWRHCACPWWCTQNSACRQLAVIEELIEGLDGFTRAAKIHTKIGKTSRPIIKLYPLEITEDVTPKLTRNATIKAHERIKSWTKTLSTAPEDVKD